MLVSLCPDIITANNNTTALGNILLNFLLLLNNKYIMDTYR